MALHKKASVFGILLVCGFLLTSVDDCESWYLVEQEQTARLAQAEQERATQERLRQEERAKQEQAVLASRQASQSSTSQTSTSQSSQTTAGSQTSTAAAQSTGQAQGTAGAADSQNAAGSQAVAVSPSTTGTTQGQSTAATASGSTQDVAQSTQGSAAQDQGTAAQGGAAVAQGGATSGTSEESTTPPGSTGASYVSTITGKEWKLSEVRLPGKTMLVDRNKLTAEKMGDLFTFTIDNSRISGKAAPNRYTSMYQAGPNNALTIQAPISTLMASIYDPERIREREYFLYISRVKSWKLNQGKLELYTTDASNKEVVLVYGN
jgi:hypothetical protein